MEFNNPRLNALLYMYIGQKIDLEEKPSSISFFINKFIKQTHKKIHIMSFLNNKVFIIESINNLQPITFSNSVSICIIYTNNNKLYYDRIVGIFVNSRGIIFKTNISNGNQNLFESEDGRLFELGNLYGIKYSSIIGNSQFISKIIIYDNGVIITPHKYSKSYEHCRIIAIAL
jgi:hypothetical protein